MNSIADEAIFREVLCQAFCVLPRRRWSSSRLQNHQTIREKSLETENMATYHELRSVSTSDVPLNFRKVTLDVTVLLDPSSTLVCCHMCNLPIHMNLGPFNIDPCWMFECLELWIESNMAKWKTLTVFLGTTHEEIMCGWIVTRKP